MFCRSPGLSVPQQGQFHRQRPDQPTSVHWCASSHCPYRGDRCHRHSAASAPVQRHSAGAEGPADRRANPRQRLLHKLSQLEHPADKQGENSKDVHAEFRLLLGQHIICVSQPAAQPSARVWLLSVRQRTASRPGQAGSEPGQSQTDLRTVRHGTSVQLEMLPQFSEIFNLSTVQNVSFSIVGKVTLVLLEM